MRSFALSASLAVLLSPAFAIADEKSKLVLDVTATREIYPDEAPAVSATIYNGGKDDAYIVRAIDGSFDNLRSVVSYKWVVKKNGQLHGRRRDVVRIDNHVNAFGGDDVLLVKAGKEVELGTGGFGNFSTYYDLSVPGKYTIVLSYEMNPAGREKLGVGGEKAIELIGKQPAVSLESKPVEVTVIPFPPAVAAAADRLKLAEAKLQIVKQFAETVVKNPNSTAEQRDEAAERLKRAAAVLDEATSDHAAKLAEFRKKRAEERKKK